MSDEDLKAELERLRNEFGVYIQREIAKWTQVVRDANIKID